MANWTKKRAKTKVISFFRQIVAYEYDHTRLYMHVEDPKNICDADYVINKVNKLSKGNESEEFNDLIENSKGFMPVASSVHNFLRKFDAEWYNSQKAFSE